MLYPIFWDGWRWHYLINHVIPWHHALKPMPNPWHYAKLMHFIPAFVVTSRLLRSPYTIDVLDYQRSNFHIMYKFPHYKWCSMIYFFVILQTLLSRMWVKDSLMFAKVRLSFKVRNDHTYKAGCKCYFLLKVMCHYQAHGTHLYDSSQVCNNLLPTYLLSRLISVTRITHPSFERCLLHEL